MGRWDRADTIAEDTAGNGVYVDGVRCKDGQIETSALPFTGTPTGAKFLRDDFSWQAPGGGGEAFPVGSVFIAVVSTDPATLLGYGTWSAFATGRMLIGLDSGDTDFDTAEEVGGAKTHTLATGNLPSHSHAVTDPGHNHTQDAHNHGVTDPGHTHITQRYPTSTGGSSGFTIDTSMSGTLADNTLPTKSATTGVSVNNATATNQSNTTGITIGNTGSGTAVNHMPPFIAVYMWKRTA